MVETQLTDKLVEEGARLIRTLDESGVSPDAAFWYYFPDSGAWKLILVEMKVGPEGPRDIYKRIQKALNNLSPRPVVLSLEDVALEKPDAPIVSVLRSAIQTGRNLGGIRFTKNVVNGTLIDDAYIYRLAKPAA